LSRTFGCLPIGNADFDERSHDGRAAIKFVQTKEAHDGYWHREMVQPDERPLNEGQLLHYDVVSNRGKEAAENLKAR